MRAPFSPDQSGDYRKASGEPSGAGADDANAYRTHAQADYSDGSEWVEVWFRNECQAISGMTSWGRYTYSRWWKGLCARYVRIGSPDASAAGGEASGGEMAGDGDAGDEAQPMEELFSYAELEHEAAGPTLTVGLWRLPVLPSHLQAEREKVSVQFCLAKAKAFGIKRIVHRISIPYVDLVNRRTIVTWVED